VKDSELKHRFQIANQAVDGASALARTFFEHLADLRIESKGVHDHVTAADREVEGLLRNQLIGAFPQDHFLAEEGGGEVGDAVWVVDPIDGTNNFVRGIASFGISVAFVWNGRTEIGIIDDPIYRERFAVLRGQSPTLNGAPISVRIPQGPQDSVVQVGRGPNDRHPLPEVLGALLDAGFEFRRTGSAALGLAHVAAGRLDAFYQSHLNAWDVLAGLLLVNEAGGVSNDFFEDEGLTRGNPTLATSRAIAHELEKITGIAVGKVRKPG
jgi:myo-inositol-1(or 4)-monophosphatase